MGKVEESKRVPALRFRGFEQEWERHLLGDFGTVAMNKRIFKSQTRDKGEIPFYKIGSFGGVADAFISKDLFEEYKSKFQYPEYGDILISASGSIGRTVEYLGKNEYFQDSNIVWVKHDGKISNHFLKQYYSIIQWNGLEGSTIKRLYNKSILSTEVNIPSLPEQKKIGSFFQNIDRLISLHQQQYDKLAMLKKAMLVKMFPRDGAVVPELRFKGFDGEWQEKKLGEVATFSKGKGLSKSDLISNGKYECVLYGHLYTEYGMTFDKINFHTNSESWEVQSRYGDVLIPSSDTTPTGLARATCIEKSNIVLGGDINVVRPESYVIGSFLSYQLNSLRAALIKLVKGTTVRHLYNSDLSSLTVLIPRHESEQQKIGNYFKHLDQQIALHQTQLDKLKQIKKACLSKMFVAAD
jgi:type I restriction enzyme S subunit